MKRTVLLLLISVFGLPVLAQPYKKNLIVSPLATAVKEKARMVDPAGGLYSPATRQAGFGLELRYRFTERMAVSSGIQSLPTHLDVLVKSSSGLNFNSNPRRFIMVPLAFHYLLLDPGHTGRFTVWSHSGLGYAFHHHQGYSSRGSAIVGTPQSSGAPGGFSDTAYQYRFDGYIDRNRIFLINLGGELRINAFRRFEISAFAHRQWSTGSGPLLRKEVEYKFGNNNLQWNRASLSNNGTAWIYGLRTGYRL